MRLDWNKLINSKRLNSDNLILQSDIRSEFERDIDRIIFTTAFRRLQDKTQVFPMPKSDFVHTRLTHSIEVSRIGRTLGKLVGDYVIKKEGLIIDANKGQEEITSDTFASIIGAACLSHDIGNPPFGHSGEESFREFFEHFFKDNSISDKLNNAQKDDFLRFEGNAEGFRILTNDHPSAIEGGLRLTYTTLAAFCKYTTEGGDITLNHLGKVLLKRRSNKKIGVFQSEKKIFKKIAEELGLLKLSNEQIYYCRHPLAFITEAADNICYQIMDLEDGHKLKLITTNKVIELLKPLASSIPNDPCKIEELENIKNANERVGAFRSKAINSLILQVFEVFKDHYDEIMSGKFDEELTDLIKQKDEFEKIDKEKPELFNYQKIVAIEFAGRHVIKGLLSLYIDAYFNRKKKYGRNLLKLLPDQFSIKDYDNFYYVLIKLCGYLSRMTDSFAMDHYRTYTGHKLPEII